MVPLYSDGGHTQPCKAMVTVRTAFLNIYKNLYFFPLRISYDSHYKRREIPSLTFMNPCIVIHTMKITNKMHYIDLFIFPSRLYMFRAVFSPIIRST
jgi:hypothetical protein